MSWNLAVLLRASAQKHPTHTVVIDDDRAITYAELDEWSDRVAAGLIRHSVQPGDRIILQLPNIAEFPAYLYAILKVGAVAILAIDGHNVPFRYVLFRWASCTYR
jgi:2,3-dihydroxybenzoate-AMP ligase